MRRRGGNVLGCTELVLVEALLAATGPLHHGCPEQLRISKGGRVAEEGTSALLSTGRLLRVASGTHTEFGASSSAQHLWNKNVNACCLRVMGAYLSGMMVGLEDKVGAPKLPSNVVP